MTVRAAGLGGTAHCAARERTRTVVVDTALRLFSERGYSGVRVEDRLIGGKDAGTRSTDTMRRDHTEVGTLTSQLGALAQQMEAGPLTTAQKQDLRQTLYSLNGIVSLHFAKEEEVYLPLLDRELTAAQAQEIFEAMEKAAAPTVGATQER